MIDDRFQDMELTANIHREDEGYWAEVLELPGCFASGDTFDELFDCLFEGIRLYLEDDDEGIAPSAPLQVKAAVLSDAVPA